MNILIIGGTIFLGRHLVEAATAAGHQVTIFHRGKHGPELFPPETFPNIERIQGDRDTDLHKLLETNPNRHWDAVVDTCGYIPRLVAKSANLLAHHTDHYLFISSISVYANFRTPGQDETAPVGTLEDPTLETITNETYGPLKALCEQAAETAMPGRVLNVRAGMIVGPYDPSDRFTYWPVRAARGGEVLVPGTPDQPMDLIDMRDLADWLLHAIDANLTGVYNVAGPGERITIADVLDNSRSLAQSDARYTYIPGDFLTSQSFDPQQIHAWYIPDEEPDYKYIWDIDYTRARTHGLTYRPLSSTIQAILEWAATFPADRPWRISLDPEKEAELLQAWRAQPQ